MNKTSLFWFVISLGLLGGLQAHASSLSHRGETTSPLHSWALESNEYSTRILEVYSSQGCSSCPPAEKWVNSWLESPDLWLKFIPMVFHVDYWDYLGWRDPFAKPNYSARQSQYKHQGLANAVYTPGFMLDGKEWRGWFRGKSVSPINNKSGKLTVLIKGTDVRASFSETSPGDQLNLALLGFGFNTYVSRGENRRKSLRQEFVVLSHKEVDLIDNVWLTQVDEPSVSADQYALVAWVTSKNSLRPKQVAGGFVPNQLFDF